MLAGSLPLRLCLLPALAGIALHGFAIPSMRQPTADLPGVSKGRVSCRWVAPYVREAIERVNKRSNMTVTWFDETGKVLREVAGGTLQPGFLVVVKDGHSIIYGINGGWQLTLPTKPGMESYLTGTPDGRYFFSEDFKNDKVEIDAYRDGARITHLGPYPARDSFVQPGDDGSLAVLVWDSPAKTTPQVLVVGPDGKERFRVQCDPKTRRPVPGPDGTGALLTVYGKDGGEDGEYFAWYTAQGLRHSLDVGPNAVFMGWVPGSHLALIWTSVGEDSRYALVDWDTGKIRWDIPCPGNGQALSIALTPDYALFAVAELHQPAGGDKQWIRSFYALSLQDGSPIAYWRAQYPRRFDDRDRGAFLWRDQTLYFVTAGEFLEIPAADILAKRNGWSATPANN